MIDRCLVRAAFPLDAHAKNVSKFDIPTRTNFRDGWRMIWGFRDKFRWLEGDEVTRQRRVASHKKSKTYRIRVTPATKYRSDVFRPVVASYPASGHNLSGYCFPVSLTDILAIYIYIQ